MIKMKTRFLVSIVVSASIMFIVFHNSPAFASCAPNTDWPDAPCMDLIVDGRYPQDQVDRWTAYYDYKGAQFMESKKIQMDNAIKENQLLNWVEESIQNYNVWQYYHFSGQAPNPYPQKIGFDPISRNVTVNYYDFRNIQQNQIVYFCDGPGLTSKESCEFQNATRMGMIGLAVAGIIGIPIALFGRKRK